MTAMTYDCNSRLIYSLKQRTTYIITTGTVVHFMWITLVTLQSSRKQKENKREPQFAYVLQMEINQLKGKFRNTSIKTATYLPLGRMRSDDLYVNFSRCSGPGPECCQATSSPVSFLIYISTGSGSGRCSNRIGQGAIFLPFEQHTGSLILFRR